jgi:UDP-N-acetylglucosamine 4,6-dehydratase/5-epimerase
MRFKNILVTGGTGSFGKSFVKRMLNDYPDLERIVILSRDELKQFEFQNELSASDLQKCRFFIGDVRDNNRLRTAFENIDLVVHAAAMKHVTAAEYNPYECVLTNVIGAQNVVEACLHNNVKKLVALSTDKAAAPVNLYGATKLCSDKLIIASNNIKGDRAFSASVVRYGNVFGSRGSIIPYFRSLDGDIYPITDERMTRFNISLSDGIKMVIEAAQSDIGSEIFVPKIPSYKVMDLAKALNPNAQLKFVGIRPGEKLHEEMVTESDAENTLDLGKYYALFPHPQHESYKYYRERNIGTPVQSGFSYNSYDNTHYLNVAELTELVRQYDEENNVD